MMVNIGDTVQSHDFPDRGELSFVTEGEHACFAEGEVVAILKAGEVFTFTSPEGEGRKDAGREYKVSFHDCDHVAIRVTRRVFAGEVKTGDAAAVYVFPPQNGIPKLFGGETNGIRLIEAAK